MKLNERGNVNITETYGNLNLNQLKALEGTPQQKMDKVRSIFASQVTSGLEKEEENIDSK